MIEIELPYPPSVNNYKSVGRTIRTTKGKIYQQRVNTNETKMFYYEVWLAIKNLNAIKRIPMPIQSIISIEVYLHPPDKRKRDIDNVLKALIDSLVKGGLLQDDSQINKLLVEKREIVRGGKVILKICQSYTAYC